jgi:2-keto-4-pentenoate hydratase/2-oxohepta-3-ene-1,7-dioic acid hydratase in catechol pathway
MDEIQFQNSKETLTVQNVYCVGKNYIDHIKELDSHEIKSEIPKEPVIFLKPNTSVITNSKKISIPEFKGKKISTDLQNEVELVVVIGKDGENITGTDACKYIAGYAVGIDFTLRDVQNEFKKKGLPWTLSKGFLASAPISSAVNANKIENAENLNISLKINGELKQNANTSQMIFKIGYVIQYISSVFGLKKGDLIFTGTPAGVTRLNPGDLIEAQIEKIGKLEIKVVK